MSNVFSIKFIANQKCKKIYIFVFNKTIVEKKNNFWKE